MRALAIAALALAAAATAACGGNHASPDAATDARASFDAHGTPDAAVDAGPFSQGLRVVDGCKSLGLGVDVCDYTFVYSPGVCANHGCKRLVIFFAGNDASCPSVTDAASYLVYYQTNGYVAVCARAFTSPGTAGKYPRHLEAPRFDRLVKAITADPDIRAAWSGEYLLFSGLGHGASSPVVAMATTADDDDPAWQGSKYTGACFFDGSYDAGGLLDFTYTHQCVDTSAVLPYSHAYARYCAFTGDGNTPAGWPAPSSCATADVSADTITAAAPTAFAIKDWALIECGSGEAACSGTAGTQDVMPASSIQTMCTDLAGGAGYTCQPSSYPTTGHLACGTDPTTKSACATWFEAQLSSHGLS